MIMLTSNNTPAEEYDYAKKLGAILNLDDISHIDYVDKNIGLPSLISFRYNPGPLKGGNAIIGVPEEAKYGLTREQLFDAYRTVKERGVKNFGLHTMIASNELNADYFVDTAEILFDLVYDLSTEVKIDFDFVNLGGGFGIPYRPGDKPLDLDYIGEKIHQAYEERSQAAALNSEDMYGERQTDDRTLRIPRDKGDPRKNIYKNYIGVDACMADLMRPALYGAYHHITVLGKENAKQDHRYDVTGSLCENNDKFAIDRMLLKLRWVISL
jgi:diaminopimelate decarboxylase